MRITFEFDVNINDFVKVRLTELGRDILLDDLSKVYPNLKRENLWEVSPYHIDDDGYLKIQFWNFMSIFGSHFWNGAPQVIEHNEIIFMTEVHSGRY